jgi:Cdc6-like AAA superfamily ATPase
VKHCVNNFATGKKGCHELFINAASVSAAPEAILDEISKIIGKKSSDPSNPDSMMKLLLKNSKQRKMHIVLVLDEVDFLLKGLGNKKKKFDESILGIVLGWASNPAYSFTLIGISNSVGSSDARTLHKCSKVSIYSPLYIEKYLLYYLMQCYAFIRTMIGWGRTYF